MFSNGFITVAPQNNNKMLILLVSSDEQCGINIFQQWPTTNEKKSNIVMLTTAKQVVASSKITKLVKLRYSDVLVLVQTKKYWEFLDFFCQQLLLNISTAVN